jgi:hypothetical protein
MLDRPARNPYLARAGGIPQKMLILLGLPWVAATGKRSVDGTVPSVRACASRVLSPPPKVSPGTPGAPEAPCT